MKIYKTLALSTAAVIGLGISSSYADAGANFTSHHLVEAEPYENYVEHLPGKEKLEIREYLDYEQREPCQFYQPIPQGFMRDGCDLKRKEPVHHAVKEQVTTKVVTKTVKRNVLADYEVNFAFDSAAIEPAAGNTLDRVAREIKTYKPAEVTVAGYADRSGPADYNMALSHKRAQAVSDALTEKGVPNRVLDKEAHGENDPEVYTPDGVRNSANRRVEIQFIK